MNQINSLLSLLLNKKTHSDSPPKQVGEYHLFKPLNSSTGNHRYATGVYKSGRKKAFIKTWTGTWPNYDFYSLKDEANIAQLLQKYIPGKKTKVKFVRVQNIFSTPGQLSVVYDYIPGKSLQNYSVGFQSKILNQVISFLHEISQSLSTSDRSVLPKRSLMWHFAVFVTKLTKSRMNIGTKLRVFKHFMTSFLNLGRQTPKLTLAHGDLLPQNVLIYKNKPIVIDFGHASLTLPDYDLAYIASQPKNKNLINMLLPQGLLVTQIYLSKILAAVSAVSAESCTVQDFFIKYLCA